MKLCPSSDIRFTHLLHRVICDNDDGVGVGDPHVAQMPVLCKQLPVLPLSDVLQALPCFTPS